MSLTSEQIKQMHKQHFDSTYGAYSTKEKKSSKNITNDH